MYEQCWKLTRIPQRIVGLVEPQSQPLAMPLQAPDRVWPIMVTGAPELEAVTVLYDMVHVQERHTVPVPWSASILVVLHQLDQWNTSVLILEQPLISSTVP